MKDNLGPSSRLIRNSIAEFLIFTTRANISIHLRNVYDSVEPEESTTCKDFLHVRQEGQRQISRRVAHYNLDAIISMGYRVNSVRTTRFRRWDASVLRDFAIRGWVIDRRHMENGAFLGKDYFERLLDEIREIRLSDRRFYQKVTDIYATSVDYNKDAPTTKRFFTTVQNKLHYAVHGHTAAELIASRARADQPHMGLTSWANSPDGKILRGDVIIGRTTSPALTRRPRPPGQRFPRPGRVPRSMADRHDHGGPGHTPGRLPRPRRPPDPRRRRPHPPKPRPTSTP